MKIKAAIFDMDGTLVDSLSFWNEYWSALGKRYANDPNFRPDPADDKKVRTMHFRAAAELIHERYGFGTCGEELLEYGNELLREFYKTVVKPKEGVREFLSYAKAQGVKMCIASATDPEYMDIALQCCDLKKYFLKIFSCVDLGVGKDKPDIFLLASEFLDEAPADTWVFEDSLTAIETAASVGMPTVGIYDRFNFGHERMRAIATEYIAPGETLCKLI